MSIFSRIFKRDYYHPDHVRELRAQLLKSEMDNDMLRASLEAQESLMAAIREDNVVFMKKYDKLESDYELRRKDINTICRLNKEVYKALILFLYELDSGGGYSESRLKDRRQDLLIASRAQGWSVEETNQILTEYQKKYGIETEILL